MLCSRPTAIVVNHSLTFRTLNLSTTEHVRREVCYVNSIVLSMRNLGPFFSYVRQEGQSVLDHWMVVHYGIELCHSTQVSNMFCTEARVS